MKRRVVLIGLGVSLAGCGEGGWLGEREAPPLPGTRVPVLLLDEEPKADPRLANLVVVLPAPVANADWPQFGGDPTHRMGHLAAASDRSLPAWRVSIGRGAPGSARLLSPPVAAAGVLFAVDASPQVVALGAGDGRTLWTWRPEKTRVDDRVAGGGAAVSEGVVYVTLSHGEVAALRAASGEPLWTARLLAPLRAPPTVAQGFVLVRTADSQLLALDAATGQLRWRYASAAEPAAIQGGAPPAVAGRTVVTAFPSGEVTALALDNGRPLWSEVVARPRRTLALGSILDISGAPVIDRDRVIVAGNGGEVAALDLRSGQRLWDAPVGSLGTPWVAGEFIYLVTERGELVCMLRQGGRIRWVSPLNELARPAGTGVVWTAPVLVGDRLVLGNSVGEFASVSPYTGEVLGKVALGARISQPAIVAGGVVYVLTDTAELVAFR
ncbi:MAG: PQQ-binding-like beta-propeller repeat protein [Geminicoccaceae bacterium]|nr:PQQ-binding-like beta-propeller repeat protein [Geminicoccaceae bacterium]MDW8125172.1 PQQ-binding-like beta-propeller repeat protein [Geminicoccaceae bacterium]